MRKERKDEKLHEGKRVEYSLCSSCSACPSVRFDKDKLIITDDFGGKVTLKKEEVLNLVEKIRKTL